MPPAARRRDLDFGDRYSDETDLLQTGGQDFWSWQSNTPGDTGRHFIRKALLDAIAVLKQPEDIEEPTQADRRHALVGAGTT